MMHYLIVNDRIGSGDERLGATLMKNYLYTLARTPHAEPPFIMLMNAGVHLSCTCEETIADLKLLEEQGATVKSCGTCLNFYGLTDQLQVGEVGSIVDTVEASSSSDTTTIVLG